MATNQNHNHGKKVLLYHEKTVNRVLHTLAPTTKLIDESFIALCKEAGIKATTELFRGGNV